MNAIRGLAVYHSMMDPLDRGYVPVYVGLCSTCRKRPAVAGIIEWYGAGPMPATSDTTSVFCGVHAPWGVRDDVPGEGADQEQRELFWIAQDRVKADIARAPK